MVSPFDTLKQDVQNIFSYNDMTTKTYTNEYEFENNKVTIIFERTWIGKAAYCGLDMDGTANVKMENKDSTLENRIKKIISIPTYSSWGGPFPVVSKINFN